MEVRGFLYTFDTYAVNDLLINWHIIPTSYSLRCCIRVGDIFAQLKIQYITISNVSECKRKKAENQEANFNSYL